MALSARYSKATDTFDSSITADWDNGVASFGTMSWVAGGHIQPTADFTSSGMRRITETFGNNQYSKAVINSQNAGAGSYANVQVNVRLQATDGGYQAALISNTGADARYRIWEISSGFGFTDIGSTGTAATSYTAGDFIVLEISGTSLEVYTSESGGAETSRLTATSGTWSTGRPGVGGNKDATLTITSWEGGDDVAPGPTINTQPSDATAYSGQAAQFTVAATTSGGTLTYQWQRSTDGGTSYSNVSGGSGGTTTTYTTPTLGFDEHNYLYRCAVTDSNGTTNTRGARLTIIPVSPVSWIRA